MFNDSMRDSIALDRYLTTEPELSPEEEEFCEMWERATPEEFLSPMPAEMRDQYTLGRSRYVAGQMLQDCTTIAERAGYIGAEADGRRADLRAMLEVSFDEWQLHKDDCGSSHTSPAGTQAGRRTHREQAAPPQ